MLTLNIDLETTITNPVDPTKAQIIELGGVVWDWEKKAPAIMFQWLVWDSSYVWTESIRELTGIELQHLQIFGVKPHECLQELYWKIIQPTESFAGKKIEYAIAHNGTIFDSVVFKKALETTTLESPVGEKLANLQWIDSMVDSPWPKTIATRKLAYLAAEYGLINPFPHRSLTDALVMTEIIKDFDINEIIKRKNAPKVIAVADCRAPWKDPNPAGAKDTDKAKVRGYKFNPERKLWCKEILLEEFEAEKELCKDDFRVGQLVKE